MNPHAPAILGPHAYRVGTTSPADGPNSQKRFSLRDHDTYVSLTMEFRCNLRCTHCMIEGTMDRLAPTDAESFDRVLAEQAATAPWQGLVLTGSEITLRRDLPELARRARAAGFAHVRIQTHGMHLNRAPYLESLIDAGVDEFFISVAGQDAATHDHITRVPGSWARMMQGIALGLSPTPSSPRNPTPFCPALWQPWRRCTKWCSTSSGTTFRWPKMITNR
jgi:wyosine [tRNA(Phe)-imidazoG37] synthetase (radical SAM superfamily)